MLLNEAFSNQDRCRELNLSTKFHSSVLTQIGLPSFTQVYFSTGEAFPCLYQALLNFRFTVYYENVYDAAAKTGNFAWSWECHIDDNLVNLIFTQQFSLRFPLTPPKSSHQATDARIALLLASAKLKYFKSQIYWAKDIIFLITEHE